MRKHALVTLAVVGAAVMGAAAANAAPIIYTVTTPLSTLVAGAGNGDAVVVGDKIFFNFAYTTSGADMPAASGVNVIPHTDAYGNFGLRFQGGFQDLPGGSGNGASDALITYEVFVLDPNFRISDAHIAGNTSVTGTGSITVTETWTPDIGNALIKIYDLSPGGLQLVDSVVFDQTYSHLFVQKDILANAGPLFINDQPNFSRAEMSFVDQTYSQVPEPASVGVLALGAAGLLMRRRKA